MIVLDSSALVAIFLKETGMEHFRDVLEQSNATHISAVNYMETRMVLTGYLSEAVADALDKFLFENGIEIVSVTSAAAKQAYDAHRKFGKGRHSAKLNICDCFAYALAKSLNAPLLYKGSDFSQTDITSAL